MIDLTTELEFDSALTEEDIQKYMKLVKQCLEKEKALLN